jgi:hypothetical protein
LPGCEAFTTHALRDSRIDMGALKKNVGLLPTDPAEQNSKWFKLYRVVGDDAAVAESHRSYLLYRDMAAMSLLLIFVVPVALWSAGSTLVAAGTSAAVFLVQFFACTAAARQSGRRFVCNVLAIHSAKKITGSAPKPGP